MEINCHTNHWWRTCKEYCQHTAHHHDNKPFEVAFTVQKRQIPLQLAFAMTINKVQGQTTKTIGIYLPKPVFTHNQLYVALSRTTRVNDVIVFCPNGKTTTNVVYTKLL
jgi:ATP-dependent exoDNAse (exonuclease V) alpha subunit